MILCRQHHRRRSDSEGLRDHAGRGPAPPLLHQPRDPHLFPTQRHLGRSQPLPEQGPAPTSEHHPGDTTSSKHAHSPQRHQRKCTGFFFDFWTLTQWIVSPNSSKFYS